MVKSKMQYYEIEKDEGSTLSSRTLQNAVAIDEMQGKEATIFTEGEKL